MDSRRALSMSFYLKKTKNNKGVYLQIYQNIYIPGKGNRGHSFKPIGYLHELSEQRLKEVNEEIDLLNSANKTVPQISETSASKNLGCFVLHSMFDVLNWNHDLNLMTLNKKFHFDLDDFIKTMIYAQVVNPGSKLNAFENVIPNIYNTQHYSYDQILDGINYIGMDYSKFIELLNHHINKLVKRETEKVYFDCTNYYFEIDLEDNLRRKGPSKENRADPIMGQALLLDSMQIPIGMMLYPGNESEKPKIRKQIEELKERYGVEGKIVQIADKGLNCARNIYTAVKEAHDGYIFSKSIHGKNLSDVEKIWVLLDDNDENKWFEVKDEEGKIKYKYKSCVDTFPYEFEDENGEIIKFTVEEKRVVTYSPSLAKKKKAEINKEVEKAKCITSIKEVEKGEYGDCIKYVIFPKKDSKGKKITPAINKDKIDEDLSLAGYNLLVTSEIKQSEIEIYNAYHGLWKIENSFRIMKSYLNARPAFLQNQDSIYGHFLIVYIALTILRLLETYVFKLELSAEQLISFIRNYTITKNKDNTYINNATKSLIYEKVKQVYGLSKLGDLYLKAKEVENIYNAIAPFDETLDYQKYCEISIQKALGETKKKQKKSTKRSKKSCK